MKHSLMFVILIIIAIPVSAWGSRLVLQAESAKYSSGTIDKEYAGYTGTGYLNTANATGAWVEFEFGVQAAASDTLFFIHDHNKSDDRTVSITVNGTVVVSSLSFTSTGAWTTWNTVTTVVPLQAGINVVRLTALTSGGLANLDRMEVGGTDGSFQYKLSVTSSGHGSVVADPSATYYNDGAVVTLTAVPSANAAFKGWSGDTATTANPITLTMSTTKSVTATFETYVASAVYCSTTGNDSTGDGSFSKPYYSLAKAVATVSAGDTIYMRGGSYYYGATVEITAKGTAAQRYYVLAYPGERPVLNYSNWTPATETIRFYARGIHVDTCAAYWYFKGLEICYSPDNGVKCEGDHTTFDQCIFDYNGDSGIQIGLNKEDFSSNPNPEHWAAYTVVINCDSYHNNDPATSYENADGFACKLYAGKGNHFYGCRSYYNIDDGWDCYQTNYLLIIENCWAWHNGDPGTVGLSSSNGDGNGFKLGGNDEPCPLLVKNCVSFNTKWATSCGFNDNNNATALDVINCVAWQCVKNYCFDDGPTHRLTNCVSFSPFTKDYSLASADVITNCSWGISSITASVADFGDTTEAMAMAPREADGGLPKNNFARLVAGSDLINKGTVITSSLIGADIPLPAATIKTIDGTPDLGAYEYGVILPTVPDSIFIIPNSGSSTTSIQTGKATTPKTFTAVQNYPNPFNPTTKISFTVSAKAKTTLKVYDIMGREVAELFNGEANPGQTYTTDFHATRLASGVYFSVVQNGNQRVVNKMALMK
jgi:pectate disaccharide-lyase